MVVCDRILERKEHQEMTCKLADESLEAGKFLDPEAAGEGGQGRQHLRHSLRFVYWVSYQPIK
jgi:hypothetical protein